MPFEQVCQANPLAGIWATWRHSNMLQILPIHLAHVLVSLCQHDDDISKLKDLFDTKASGLVTPRSGSWSTIAEVVRFHFTKHPSWKWGKLPELPDEIEAEASETKAIRRFRRFINALPEEVFKAAEKFVKKKSQFQRQELWGMRIFADDLHQCKLARSCTWEMWRSAVWSSNTRTSRSVRHEVQSHRPNGGLKP